MSPTRQDRAVRAVALRLLWLTLTLFIGAFVAQCAIGGPAPLAAQRTPAPYALEPCVVFEATEKRDVVFVEIAKPRTGRCALDVRHARLR